MIAIRRRVSKRDAAIVAAALLLPIPVLAQTGLSVPLPGGLDQGIGSLVTLDSDDATTGSQASGQAGGGSADGSQSGGASLKLNPGGLDSLSLPTDVTDLGVTESGDASDSAQSADSAGGGDSADASAGSEPGSADGSGDDTGDSSGGSDAPAGSGGSGSAGGSANSSTAPTPQLTTVPTLTVSGGGPGSSSVVSIGENGLEVDLGADDGAASGEEGNAGVQVTQGDGSSTGLNVALPGVGGLLP